MRPFYAYVVLTRTNTVFSRMIHLVKRDEYTHASITLDHEMSHMYSFGRKYTYNPFIGVFKREEIHKGIFRVQKQLPSRIYRIELTPAQYYKLKKLIDDFVSNQDDLKYNYMGIIHSLQRKRRFYKDRFLCSEFVYHVLKECRIVDLEKPRNLVRPQDFSKANWEIVFEGDLKAYRPISEVPQELYVKRIVHRGIRFILNYF